MPVQFGFHTCCRRHELAMPIRFGSVLQSKCPARATSSANEARERDGRLLRCRVWMAARNQRARLDCILAGKRSRLGSSQHRHLRYRFLHVAVVADVFFDFAR
ncbi:hypothetical protein SEVIR_2G117866v4 [Setaria viridis]|uniref:Uncharacterized protein n=1 Tax=Setaria viridis TaxID=4556 RepID=A0A4U6VRT6_SETVI|nr:hypothetical protein SEVIR_2G117866v2 [Setaria viridis]